MLVAMFWQGHIDVELNEVGREQAAVVRYQFVFHVGCISISVSCSQVGKFSFLTSCRWLIDYPGSLKSLLYILLI